MEILWANHNSFKFFCKHSTNFRATFFNSVHCPIIAILLDNCEWSSGIISISRMNECTSTSGTNNCACRFKIWLLKWHVHLSNFLPDDICAVKTWLQECSQKANTEDMTMDDGNQFKNLNLWGRLWPAGARIWCWGVNGKKCNKGNLCNACSTSQILSGCKSSYLS